MWNMNNWNAELSWMGVLGNQQAPLSLKIYVKKVAYVSKQWWELA